MKHTKELDTMIIIVCYSTSKIIFLHVGQKNASLDAGDIRKYLPNKIPFLAMLYFVMPVLDSPSGDQLNVS
jgi:hypothetical protein